MCLGSLGMSRDVSEKSPSKHVGRMLREINRESSRVSIHVHGLSSAERQDAGSLATSPDRMHPSWRVAKKVLLMPDG